MGRRGPAPAPTRLKLLKGTQPSRVNLREPRPLDGPVERPGWLSPAAAEEWDRVAPHLAAMGTLTGADTTALAVYCEAAARWRVLAGMAARTPPVYDRDGVSVRNPVYAQVRDAAAEVRVMAREFGLTPSARSGIRVDVHHHGQDASRLLTGG
jgi:P27 family predicted phage terminase small subunit